MTLDEIRQYVRSKSDEYIVHDWHVLLDADEWSIGESHEPIICIKGTLPCGAATTNLASANMKQARSGKAMLDEAIRQVVGTLENSFGYQATAAGG